MESYRSSVADWALLTSCDKFIIADSGLSKTAVMYSLKTDSNWLLPRWEVGATPTYACPVESPTGILVMGYSWSGL